MSSYKSEYKEKWVSLGFGRQTGKTDSQWAYRVLQQVRRDRVRMDARPPKPKETPKYDPKEGF